MNNRKTVSRRQAGRTVGPLILVFTVAFLSLVLSGPVLAMDHSSFITGPFEKGSDVTAQCLQCHQQEGRDFMQTIHWNWAGPTPHIAGAENRSDLGKKNGINNFCIGVPSNEGKCYQCHAGYGTDLTDPNAVDCLVCHAKPSTYQKGTPAGEVPPSVDLVEAAKSVGKPTNANCGKCHFGAGGGDGVKHGDIDSTLANPSPEHDIHMGGKGLTCASCHAGENHVIKGSSLHIMPTEGSLSCESCHPQAPHQNAKLNDHTDTVACETCHIPAFAKGMPTKMYWDWSQAGQDIDPVPVDSYGKETYSKDKGAFIWEQNVVPTYTWYNGKVERYLLGDPVNSDGPTVLARPLGSINDPQAKIYPFKLMRGKQPADAENGYLLVPNVVNGFWSHHDWQKALEDGAKATGLAFSGNYTFVEAEMYIGIHHEVVPAAQALSCSDCHSPNGRLDWVALGYQGDPMQVGGRLAAAGSTPPATEDLVGFRAAAEQAGAVVEWNGKDRVAVATLGSIVVKAPIGAAVGYIGDEEIALPQPTALVNGRTMVSPVLLEKAFNGKGPK